MLRRSAGRAPPLRHGRLRHGCIARHLIDLSATRQMRCLSSTGEPAGAPLSNVESPLDKRIADLAAKLAKPAGGQAASYGIDAKWAELAALAHEYLRAVESDPSSDVIARARLNLFVSFLSMWDVLWKEAMDVYGPSTLSTSDYYAIPASGIFPTSSLAAFRSKVLHSVVSAWYGCALRLGVPLPLATHTSVVRLAGLRSLSAAKLACNAVPLHGVAPDEGTLNVVLEACVRHGAPGHAWPYLNALAARGYKPREEVLDALVELGEKHIAIGNGLRTGQLVTQDQQLLQQQPPAVPWPQSAEAEGGADEAAGDAGDTDGAERGRGRGRNKQRKGGSATPPPSSPVLTDPFPFLFSTGSSLPRDPGVTALLQHSLGLQAERVRSSIAELRAMKTLVGQEEEEGRNGDGSGLGGRGGDGEAASAGGSPSGATNSDTLLNLAAAAVNQAYGMPVEPSTAAAAAGQADKKEGEEGAAFTVPPLEPGLTSPEAAIAIMMQDQQEEDDDHDDDEDLEEEDHDPEDEAAYQRLASEAAVVRAALFGSQQQAQLSAEERAAEAAVDEALAVAYKQLGGSGGASIGGDAPTTLIPGWVLQSLAAETARRELVAGHLLPTMLATATGTGSSAVPPPPSLADRLEFVCRHSILHLMPDSPQVTSEVTRWQVALLALGRTAAADVKAQSSSTNSASATEKEGIGSAGHRYVSIPYLRLLCDPTADPRRHGSILPTASDGSSSGGAADDERAVFRRLHPLYVKPPPSSTSEARPVATAPGSPSSRLQLSRCLHRLYSSLSLDMELEGVEGGPASAAEGVKIPTCADID